MKRRNWIAFVAGKMIGSPTPSLEQLYTERKIQKAKIIIGDEYHPMNHLFQLLPSGSASVRCMPEQRGTKGHSYIVPYLFTTVGDSLDTCDISQYAQSEYVYVCIPACCNTSLFFHSTLTPSNFTHPPITCSQS